jgi:hypothetical protein
MFYPMLPNPDVLWAAFPNAAILPDVVGYNFSIGGIPQCRRQINQTDQFQ